MSPALQNAVSKLEALTPRSLPEALRMLRDEGPLVPLAGCTDLFVLWNASPQERRRFLDLWRLDALRRIEIRGETLRIGALCTYTQMQQSRDVSCWIPMLAAASRQVGGVQIQNRGTLGGNLANASPAGDTLPVLAAADATIILRSHAATRRLSIERFFTGYRKTALLPSELIVAVEVPRIDGRQWFRKIGTRAAQAIAKVSAAGVRADAPRFALGSVAPTVVRAHHAEAALAGGASIAAAQAALLDDITPIDDLRSTAAYRSRIAQRLLARFWEETSA